MDALFEILAAVFKAVFMSVLGSRETDPNAFAVTRKQQRRIDGATAGRVVGAERAPRGAVVRTAKSAPAAEAERRVESPPPVATPIDVADGPTSVPSARRRANPVLWAFGSPHGLLGAVIASELLAPPLSARHPTDTRLV